MAAWLPASSDMAVKGHVYMSVETGSVMACGPSWLLDV